MLDALIFDVDGTLSETEELHRWAFNETFRQRSMSWGWSQDDYRLLLKTTGGKERMRAHRDALGLKEPSDDLIADMHRQKTSTYTEAVAKGRLTLRRGVKDVMAWGRAHGLRLAVATTTNRPNVDALSLACFGAPAEEVFDVIAAGDEVPRKKPAPDVFLLALERLGIGADAAVAFEDSRNGLRSALDAGLDVLVTPSVYTSHEEFPEARMVAPDMLGFMDWLTSRHLAVGG